MQKPFRPLDAIGSPHVSRLYLQGIKQQHIVSMRQKRLKLFSIHISFIPIHVLFRKYPVFRQRPSSVRQSCGRQVISLSIFVTPLRSRKDVRLECCAQLCRGRSFFRSSLYYLDFQREANVFFGEAFDRGVGAPCQNRGAKLEQRQGK